MLQQAPPHGEGLENLIFIQDHGFKVSKIDCTCKNSCLKSELVKIWHSATRLESMILVEPIIGIYVRGLPMIFGGHAVLVRLHYSLQKILAVYGSVH
jgi:hypothetical protein